MKKSVYRVIVWSLVALLSLLLFLYLMDAILPYKAGRTRVDRTQAIEIAKKFALKKGLDVDRFHVAAITVENNRLFSYLQKNLGYEETVNLMQNEMPEIFAMRWEVYWYQNLPRNAPQERFFVYVSTQGEIVQFNHSVPKDTTLCPPAKSHLSQNEALELSLDFLRRNEIDISEFEKSASSSHTFAQRTDHSFEWQRACRRVKGHIKISVRIQGNEIAQFSQGFTLPQKARLEWQHRDSDRFTVDMYSIIFLLLIYLLPISLFLKKYHAGEISIKTAKIFFFVLWIAMMIKGALAYKVMANAWALGELSYDEIAVVKLLFYILIIYPFLSSFAFTSWSVGESLAREKFDQKLATLDAVVNLRIFTKTFAVSALRGYASGFVILALTAVSSWILLHLFDGTLQLDGYRNTVSYFLPFLVPFVTALIASLMAELVFRLFANLYFFRLLKYKAPAVILSAIMFSFSSMVIWKINLFFTPYYLYPIVVLLNGLFLGYLFWRYDVVTVLFANFIAVGILYTIPIISNPNLGLHIQGGIALILLFSPLVPVVRGLRSAQTFTHQPDTMPEHIKRISERERMARELEIARQVQMKLLPKENPSFDECDIAGFCMPAEKVGGDYYDYISLDKHRIGLVIGDVSGKGVPASIYMTLTKGVFQSYAKETSSPRKLLIKVNEILYRTIEPGTFISLFYSVLDVRHKSLTYARGGHNPVIFYNAQTDTCNLLESNGMALGLESGHIFNPLLTETALPLHSNDVLVFYTDGFIEAMNEKLLEYSEKKLVETVYLNRHKSAQEIINRIDADVKRHMKNYPQYDDMTMIVVKIH